MDAMTIILTVVVAAWLVSFAVLVAYRFTRATPKTWEQLKLEAWRKRIATAYRR
jgi:hypothetical protein